MPYLREHTVFAAVVIAGLARDGDERDVTQI